MLEYMIFVLGMFILGMLEVVGNKVEKATLILLIFFIGFRAEIGTDWYAYSEHFYGRNQLKLEFFFEKSMQVFKNLSLSFESYYITISLITLLLLYYGMKKITSYPTMGLVFFVLSNQPSLIFEQIRQFLVIALFLNIYKTNWKKYYIFSFFLLSIHLSILVTIIQPILNKKYKLIKYFFLFFSIIFIVFRKESIEVVINLLKNYNLLKAEFLNKLYYYYGRMGSGYSMGIYIKTIFIIFLFQMKKRIVKFFPNEKKEIELYYNSSIIYLVLLYFFFGLIITQRIVIYYQFGVIFLSIYLIMSYKDIKMRILNYTLISLFFSMTFFSFMINFRYFIEGYTPYKNYLYSNLNENKEKKLKELKILIEKVYEIK